MCRRRGRAVAVRSLLLLPRLNVSIVFKMFPCQCFKPLRHGSALRMPRRPFYRLSIPSLFRRNCFGLIACVLCVAARPAPRAVIRLPLLAPRYAPSDTIGGAGVCGSSRCLPDGASDGSVVRFRLVVAVMRPLRLLAPCVPRIARRRAALSYRRRSPFAWCFRMMLSLARFRHTRRTISPRPSTRETGSRAGRTLILR